MWSAAGSARRFLVTVIVSPVAATSSISFRHLSMNSADLTMQMVILLTMIMNKVRKPAEGMRWVKMDGAN